MIIGLVTKAERREINGIKQKRCTKCGEWLDETSGNFYMVNKSKPEKGYVSACKKCSIKDGQGYVQRHYEDHIKYVHKRYSEFKDVDLKRKQEWYQNNKDKCLEYAQRYFENNKEKFLLYNKQRNHKNHRITKCEWKSCLKYFNNQCAYCGLSASEHFVKIKGNMILQSLHKEHVDHEGLNDLSNCVPACKSCNDRKWLFTMEEWYREQDYFDETRLTKIYKWCCEDYEQYIENKPSYIIKRERHKNDKNYDFNLWSVDENGNMKDIIFTGSSKKEVKEYIKDCNIEQK